jgi:serine/threonine protein kinase/tetratricopeptide (TPR) repeat protein
MSQPSPAPGAPPLQLAQFEVVRRLGAGGMAEVFLAKKRGAEGTFKLLVVKRILPTYGSSRRFRAMFVEEAQVATRLNHPNVVQVYEFYDGGDEGQLLAMEYVEGPDLGGLMSSAKAKGTRVAPWVAAWIVGEAAKGLHYAHEKKDEGGAPLEIVHRDVSPQNILLSFEGAVKIADFGIASAKLFSEEAGVLKGKFGYMSPEQARAERVDRRSDLYALGVIFWEILAGRPLHGGLGGEALLDIVRSGVVEPPSTYVRTIPDELEAIVMRALAPKREDRFQTGRELQTAIARALLAKQELVDATTLEQTIGQLVSRDTMRGGGNDALAKEDDPRLADLRTIAAVPAARSSAGDYNSVLRPDGTRVARESIPPTSSQSMVPIGPREVRHVAIVTMHLDGVIEGPIAERALENLRSVLNEIAYKRNTRWQWTSSVDARAVAGVSAHASRAAADAAWLALDIHEAIAGMKDDLPMPIGAAIGIVRGIASGWRDPEGNLVRYRLHDPAGYLADTISDATPLFRTWVAGGVYRLVRREFRWGDAPTLQLKPRAGLDVPPTMRIYALERSLSREERVAEISAAASDLVGRDPEKADLQAAYHEAVSGNGGSGVVTTRAIVGELGIGKTALVATFLGELPPNARLIRVECSPVRQEVPFSATADLVRDAIGTTGEEPFEEVAMLIARAGGGAAQGDATNPMVARLAELATNRQVAHGDEEDAHYRKKLVVNGVRALLAAIAMEQPLVVIVDGLQWADKSSFDLLIDILKSHDPLPILLLLVARPDDRVAALLEGIVRIELKGLSSDDQIRLVETRLGVHAGVRAICADLMPRVGGNPFFLLEMIDALLERGVLEIRETLNDGELQPVLVRSERADRDGSGMRLPSTLEQLLADRLLELPREEHSVVDWLAIAGGPLFATDLVKLSGAKDDEAVVRLCARGVCDRKGEHVEFRHPLTRDVAYQALEPPARAKMHRQLGEHLAETSLARGLSAAIVARHLARGDAETRAVEFYLEAAAAARAGYQTQLAIRYFGRAIALMAAGDVRRLGVHESLEAIYRVLGRRKERVKHLDALRKTAKEIGTPRAVCLALLRTARFNYDEGRLSQGLPVAKQAAALSWSAGLATAQIEAESLVSEFLRELGDVQGALAACDRALAACDPQVNATVPPRMRAEALRSRGVLLRRVGRVREAVDAHVDAIAVFRRVGARRQEARAKNALAYAMYVQGRYEDAIALALESIQIDLSIGGRFQLAKTLTTIGQSYGKLGDLPRGLAYLRRAREAHEEYGDQDGRGDTLVTGAAVCLEAKDLALADQLLGDAAALNAATGNRYETAYERVTRAALHRARNQPREAAAAATEARREAENQALVSFQFYALALEAAARMDLGEAQSGMHLAAMARSGIEDLQGCEYGLEIRVLCADVLKRAGAPQGDDAYLTAVNYAGALLATIRDARLRRLFARRAVVASLAAPELMAVAAEPDRFPLSVPVILEADPADAGAGRMS